MLSRSKTAERIGAMIDAMRANGPMSVPQLVTETDCSNEAIRSQIRNSSDLFKMVREARQTKGGSLPALYDLSDMAKNLSEEELERHADEMYRDYRWWPEVDAVVASAFRAMVEVRA